MPARKTKRQRSRKGRYNSNAQNQFKNRIVNVTHRQHGLHHISYSMNVCGKYLASNWPVTYCRQLLCPTCNRLYLTTRIPRVTKIFGPVLKPDIYFVSLMFDVREDLQDPVPHTPHGNTPPTYDLLKKDIVRNRRHLRESFRDAGIDSVLIYGGFEIAVKEYVNGSKNSDRFIAACQKSKGQPAPVPGNRPYCLHGHFLIAAKTDDRLLDAKELRKVLRKKFRRPAAVRVDPLKSKQDKLTAIAKCAAYCAKGHVGHDTTPDEIRQLAGALDALGRSKVSVSYSKGKLKPMSRASTQRKLDSLPSTTKSGSSL